MSDVPDNLHAEVPSMLSGFNSTGLVYQSTAGPDFTTLNTSQAWPPPTLSSSISPDRERMAHLSGQQVLLPASLPPRPEGTSWPQGGMPSAQSIDNLTHQATRHALQRDGWEGMGRLTMVPEAGGGEQWVCCGTGATHFSLIHYYISMPSTNPRMR